MIALRQNGVSVFSPEQTSALGFVKKYNTNIFDCRPSAKACQDEE